MKSLNQSSINPCLIVHLAAMWTLLYAIKYIWTAYLSMTSQLCWSHKIFFQIICIVTDDYSFYKLQFRDRKLVANIHIVNDTAVVSQQKVKDSVSSCWLQHLSS